MSLHQTTQILVNKLKVGINHGRIVNLSYIKTTPKVR